MVAELLVMVLGECGLAHDMCPLVDVAGYCCSKCAPLARGARTIVLAVLPVVRTAGAKGWRAGRLGLRRQAVGLAGWREGQRRQRDGHRDQTDSRKISVIACDARAMVDTRGMIFRTTVQIVQAMDPVGWLRAEGGRGGGTASLGTMMVGGELRVERCRIIGLPPLLGSDGLGVGGFGLEVIAGGPCGGLRWWRRRSGWSVAQRQ